MFLSSQHHSSAVLWRSIFSHSAYEYYDINYSNAANAFVHMVEWGYDAAGIPDLIDCEVYQKQNNAIGQSIHFLAFVNCCVLLFFDICFLILILR